MANRKDLPTGAVGFALVVFGSIAHMYRYVAPSVRLEERGGDVQGIVAILSLVFLLVGAVLGIGGAITVK